LLRSINLYTTSLPRLFIVFRLLYDALLYFVFNRRNNNMKNFQFTTILILAISMLSLGACKSKKGTTVKTVVKTGVKFSKSETLTGVLEQASAENKLVFVDFYTTWCMPCRLMDEDVFPDRRLGEFMNENFISYKVDAEKDNGISLATLYSVEGYPTLLFLDQKGNILERKLGAAYQREMYAMGEAAMSAMSMQ